jgi:hypothetical protein
MEMGWLHIEVTFDVLALKMSWMVEMIVGV